MSKLALHQWCPWSRCSLRYCINDGDPIHPWRSSFLSSIRPVRRRPHTYSFLVRCGASSIWDGVFYICSKRRLSFYPSFDIVPPARALVHIEEWETRIVSMCQECSGSTHSSFCSLFSSSSSLGSKSWDSASRSSPTKPSLKFSTHLLPFA